MPLFNSIASNTHMPKNVTDDPGKSASTPPLDKAEFERFAQQYTQGLIRLAERHLSRRVQTREGSEDVVQSALRTFIRRCNRGDFKIDESSQWWRLLVKITIAKARAKARFYTAAKRNVCAEDGDAADWVSTREPGPDEAAILVDQMDTLIRNLPPLYEQVLEMRLRNESVAHIADKLGVSRQTVYRALQIMRDRLKSNDDVENL